MHEPAIPESIPEPLRDSFQQLAFEIVQLHYRWLMYRQLFVTDQKGLDLLNTTANQFFFQLRPIWIDDVILAVARLLEHAEKRGRENLSLRSLTRLAGDKVPNLLPQLTKIDRLGKPFIDHRRTRIAHADPDLRLARPGTGYPPIPTTLVDEVLSEIAKFMNILSHYHGGGDILFYPMASIRDGVWLKLALRKSLDWDARATDTDYERLMSDGYEGK